MSFQGLDKDGNPVTIQNPALGRAAAAASLPTVLSNEDLAAMGQTAPASNAGAVTPSDVTTLSAVRGLWVGGAGNLTLDFAAGGTNIVIAAVPAGTLLPIAPSKVKAATTATSIVALY